MDLKWFFGIKPYDPKKRFGLFLIFIFLILAILIIFKGNYVYGFGIIGLMVFGFIINLSIAKTRNPHKNMNIFFVILGALFIIFGIALMTIESFIAGLSPLVPGILIFAYSLNNLIKKNQRS